MNVKILRRIDMFVFWTLIVLFFWLKYVFISRSNVIKRHPKKVLVIRLWALWSSLLTFPMIKQLKHHYGNDVQYDLLASSRNIGVFKNQWYFSHMYNIFNYKDFITILFAFKRYDIVIDAEEYFMFSAFMSLRLGKINIWYNNIYVRSLAYVYGIEYNDKQHSLLTTLDLLKKIGIPYEIPRAMEALNYTDSDMIKVDNFLSEFPGTFICMHTWGAETAKERAWPQKKWISLIDKVLSTYPETYIFLSGTHFEKKIVQNIVSTVSKKYRDRVINACWLFNLFEFAYLLKKCTLMISNDSWPMHLAAAMGTMTIGLFWPELPSKFGPYPLTKNIWLYKWDGSACIKVHIAQWAKDKNYRVDKITVDDVLAHIVNL